MSISKVVSMPCLYTKQKTKKRKAWCDGTLNVNSNGTCVLYGASTLEKISTGGSLDSVFLKADELRQVMAGLDTEIEMENHIVMVESLGAQTHSSSTQKENVVVHSRANPVEGPRKTLRAEVSKVSGPSAPALVPAPTASVIAAKPFKVPAFRPPSDSSSKLVVSQNVTASSISARYKGQPSSDPITISGQNVGNTTQVRSEVNRRYEGVPGSAGNGRYIVSSDEIDNLWEGEEEEGVSEDDDEQQQRQQQRLPARSPEMENSSASFLTFSSSAELGHSDTGVGGAFQQGGSRGLWASTSPQAGAVAVASDCAADVSDSIWDV
jgi:hypothetical protein